MSGLTAGAVAPATAAQAALFFDDQRLPAGCAYNITTALTVEGVALERSDVERACRSVAASTPALGARFGLDEWNGEVVQWFAAEPLEVQWIDLRNSPDGAAAALEHNARRPFDVEVGPLVRFVAVRTAPQRYLIAIVNHHLIADGRSQSVIARRLAAALAGRAQREHRASYLDLVRRVRAMEDHARQTQRDYWSARLLDAVLPAAAPPVDPAAEKRRHTGGCERTTFEEAFVERIDQLASDVGVGAFQVLVAAIHRALSQHSGLPRLVCAVASLRPAEGALDDVVGCFVNQVPLVAPNADQASTAQLLRRHAAAWRTDLRGRNYPFAEIAQQYRAQHGTAWRLGAVSLSYRQEPPITEWHDGPLRLSADVFHRYFQAKTDFSIRIFRYGARLVMEVEWSDRTSGHIGAQFHEYLRSALGE